MGAGTTELSARPRAPPPPTSPAARAACPPRVQPAGAADPPWSGACSSWCATSARPRAGAATARGGGCSGVWRRRPVVAYMGFAGSTTHVRVVNDQQPALALPRETETLLPARARPFGTQSAGTHGSLMGSKQHASI
uniref:Uncharacterized protein n=1 Tax=Oryza brachyantha TaxID=4533 RepID=J3L442_ORYBR